MDLRQAQLDEDSLRLRYILQGQREFNPAEPRDPHGKWSKIGAAAKDLAHELAKLVPNDAADDNLTLGKDGDRGYLDWSTVSTDGIRTLEVGSADGEAIRMDLDQSDLRHLASALSVTLLREHSPPPTPGDRHATLLASLMHAGQHGHVVFGNDPGIEDQDRYIDWSTRGKAGSFVVEAGANGEAVQLDMTPAELDQLHAQIVRTLLSEGSAENRSSRSSHHGKQGRTVR